MKSRLLKIVFSLFFLFFLCAFLQATTYYWVGGTSGNWSDASNWNTAQNGSGTSAIPTSSDTVYVNSPATITLTENVEISVFYIGNPNGQTNSFSVTISGDFTFKATTAETFRPTNSDASADATSEFILNCTSDIGTLTMHSGGNITVPAGKSAKIDNINNVGTGDVPETILLVKGTLTSNTIALSSVSTRTLVVESSGSVSANTITGSNGSVTNNGTIFATNISNTILSPTSNAVFTDSSNFVYWTGTKNSDPTDDENWTKPSADWGSLPLVISKRQNEPDFSSDFSYPSNALQILDGATATFSGGAVSVDSISLSGSGSKIVQTGGEISADSISLENSASISQSGTSSKIYAQSLSIADTASFSASGGEFVFNGSAATFANTSSGTCEFYNLKTENGVSTTSKITVKNDCKIESGGSLSVADFEVGDQLFLRNNIDSTGTVKCKSLVVNEDSAVIAQSLEIQTNIYSKEDGISLEVGSSSNNTAFSVGGAVPVSDAINLKSISVYGNATLGASISTTENQTYSGEVLLNADISLVSESGDITIGDSSKKITANGNKLTVKAGAEAKIPGGFSDTADLTISAASAEIGGANAFSSFVADNSQIESPTSLKFEGGKTQTFSGAVSFKGNSETNCISVSSSDSSKWNLTVSPSANVSAKNASIQNSNANVEIVVYAKDGYNEDGGGNTNWIFAGQEYTWTGATDTSWDEKSNWNPQNIPQKYSVCTIPEDCENYPILTADLDLKNDEINFGDLDGDGTNETVSSLILVKDDATLDFGGKKITANALEVEETARIRLLGTENLSGIANLPDVSSKGIFDYYGNFGTSLNFGNSYSQLEFTDGATGTISVALTVSGKTVIANGDGKSLKFTNSANSFGSEIQIGSDDGTTEIIGGNLEIAGTSLKIADGAKCSSLVAKSNIEFSGTVETTVGDLTLEQNAFFGGDATVKGAVLADGAVSANAKIESGGNQTYNGKITLGDSSEIESTSSSGTIEIKGGFLANGDSKIIAETVSVSGSEKFSANGKTVSFESESVVFVADSLEKSGTLDFVGKDCTLNLNENEVQNLSVSSNVLTLFAGTKIINVPTPTEVPTGENDENGDPITETQLVDVPTTENIEEELVAEKIEIADGAELVSAGRKITVKGGWKNDGDFVANSGKVIFAADSDISGETTFYDFECTTSATLTIESGSKLTIANDLKIENCNFGGADGEWDLTVDPDKVSAKNATIQNSKANGGDESKEIVVYAKGEYNKDGGGNTNWIFAGQEYVWTGATDNSWDEKSNWNPASVPQKYSVCTIPSVSSANYPILTANLDLKDDEIPFDLDSDGTNEVSVKSSILVKNGAVFDFGGNTLTVNAFKIEATARIRAIGTEDLSAIQNLSDLLGIISGNGIFDYYGNFGTSLIFGNSYRQLEFTDGATGEISDKITVLRTTLIANGDGNPLKLTNTENVFSDKIKIGTSDGTTETTGGILEIAGKSLKIADKAKCSSLVAKSDIEFSGTVETTAGDLTLEENAEFYGDATANGGTILIKGTTTLFANAIFDAGTNSATFESAVNGAFSLQIGTNASATNAVFGDDIGNSAKPSSLKIFGNADFQNSGSQKVSILNGAEFDGTVDGNSSLEISAKTAHFAGKIGGNSAFQSLSITASESAKIDSGLGTGASAGCSGDFTVSSSSISVKSADFVSDGKQTFSGNVSFLPGIDGTWKASEIEITKNLDFAIESNAITLDSTVLKVTENARIQSGNLNMNADISVSKDFVILGSNYGVNDAESDTNRLFEYAHSLRTAANLCAAISESFILNSTTNAVLIAQAGKTLTVNGNFYSNGAELSGSGEWFLKIPGNDSALNSFAEAHNTTAKNCTVQAISGTAFVAAAENTTAENCANWETERTFIAEAKTVYDDVIFVKFAKNQGGTDVESKIENSNNEISEAVSSIEFWNGSDFVSFSGAYFDADCTVSTDGKGDLSEFYLKAATTWNTDATGTSAGAAESSDSKGNPRAAIPKIQIPKATAAIYASLRDDAKNRIKDYSTTGNFTDTKDGCSPVLIGVYSGQELHEENAASQKDYDSHNFLEFQYSEKIDAADMTAAAGGSNFRAGESNRKGGISNESGGLKIDGFAKIASGSLVAGARNSSGGEIDAEKPHAFYRTFSKNTAESERAQTHRIRISIAGYVDGTVSSGEKNWVGYIESAQSPADSAKSHSVPNSYILDSDGNQIFDWETSQTTTNHKLGEIDLNKLPSVSALLSKNLYGKWDDSAPIFAPYFDSEETWADGGKKNPDDKTAHELVGTVRDATNPFIEKIELHLFDSAQDYSQLSRIWIVRKGWVNAANANETLCGVTGAAPEKIGGSRDKLGSTAEIAMTDGGIRKSSLESAQIAFSYKYKLDNRESEWKTADSALSQSVSSPIFRNDDYYQSTETKNDGLYISVPLTASDIAGGLPTRTTFTIRYDTDKGFITDLAGNRLRENDGDSNVKTIRSLDITPPTFSMTLAPIGKNKIYAIFTKPLSWNGKRLGELASSEWQELSEKMVSNVQFVKSQSDDVENSDYPDSAISVKNVEIKLETDDSTALLFTLSRNITLDDVEKLWIRVWGGEETINIFGELVKMPYFRDDAGNCVLDKTCHAISDFALNAVNVLYARTDNDGVDGDDWDEKGIYGTGVTADLSEDYAVHDFSADNGNYGKLRSGRDIIFQFQFTNGLDSSGNAQQTQNGESFEMLLAKSKNVKDSWLGDKLTRLTGLKWRVWLASPLDSFSSSFNASDFSALEPTELSGKPLFRNLTLSNETFSFANSDNYEFIFKIKKSKGGEDITLNHDGDTSTERVPLYALWMPESKIDAGDFSFVDLWSFSVSGTKTQRGGVSVLNNAINANVREKTVIKVDLPKDGSLNVYVLTMDGSVIKRLSRGRKSAGAHYFYWDGTNEKGNAVARGIYFVRVSGSGIDETRKVLVTK